MKFSFDKFKFNKNNLIFLIFLFFFSFIIIIFCFFSAESKKKTKSDFKDTLFIGTSSEIKNGFGMFGEGENTINNAQVRNLIHEYLIKPFEVKKNSYFETEYQPQLIKKMPIIIKQGIWQDYHEFELKTDIKFHNGDELTSDDIIETLELNRDTQGEHSQFIEKFAKSPELDKKYKFYIKFKNNKDLLNYHHLSKIPVINKKVKNQNPQIFRNIGLGSFKLKKFDPITKKVELEIFPDYYNFKLSPSNDLSNIKKIIIIFIPSLQTLYMNLEKGELDLILENMEQVYLEKMQNNKNLKLIENENLNLTYIILNSNSLSIENRKSIVQELTPNIKEEILKDLGEDLSYYQTLNVFSDNRLKGSSLSNQEFENIIRNDNNVKASKPIRQIRALFTNIDETKNRFMNKFIDKLVNEKGFQIEKIQLEKNETISKAKKGDFDIFCLTEYLENTFVHYLLNIYFGQINTSSSNVFENSEAYLNVSRLNEPSIYNVIEKLKRTDFNSDLYEEEIKKLHSLLIKKYVAIPLFQINKIRNFVRSNIENYNMNIFGEINWLKIKKK
ncbi:ABC transporter substrate-binding protein [Candidatus Phytoplasma oryzae]|nr:ABC transporter substrate-binding protein [Candidatus Phytoplasma oryzae]